MVLHCDYFKLLLILFIVVLIVFYSTAFRRAVVQFMNIVELRRMTLWTKDCNANLFKYLLPFVDRLYHMIPLLP